MERIVIFDTTLRDGEQSPGATLTPDEKLEIAKQLARMGVDVIEAGFPLSSPGDFEAVSRIAKEVRNASICGLAHADPEAVDRAWEAIKDGEDPRIHIFLSTSDIHLMHQLRKNKEEVLEQAVAMVKRAKKYVSNVEFSPMDASRSDPEYVYHVVEAAIDAGATTINIPDTVGYIMPLEFEELIRGVFAKVRNIDKAVVSVHCHNDLGMAVANSLAAIGAGARQIECTINGIGERAGNASLEEIVMALQTRRDFFANFTTRIDSTQIYKASRMVSDYTGMAVQPNKAIVGVNAFRHESGIHQDGVIKERTTYEIMDPRSIGLISNELVLGKLSGRHAFRQHVTEMGYQLSDEDLGRAFLRFKELADKKKEVTDRDLEAVISDELRMTHEIYKLDHVQVSCGDSSIPTATVRLVAPDGSILSDAALGTGPVDAIYKAINRIIGVPNKLTEFSVKSVTEGIDAIGDVTIRIESEGRSYTGRGAATDIMVASAKAYMNALNKLLAANPAFAVKQ
ncbi:MAG: 2-isopropylmalate synthase [Dehalococcoidia bacterium]|nr:2-isopropylmalate synthase [Dehalococcoidia bacterium]